jgi:hypothetical protein
VSFSVLQWAETSALPSKSYFCRFLRECRHRDSRLSPLFSKVVDACLFSSLACIRPDSVKMRNDPAGSASAGFRLAGVSLRSGPLSCLVSECRTDYPRRRIWRKGQGPMSHESVLLRYTQTRLLPLCLTIRRNTTHFSYSECVDRRPAAGGSVKQERAANAWPPLLLSEYGSTLFST